MEKEKCKSVLLDERLAKVRVMAEKAQHSTLRYRFMNSPYQKEGCRYFELSQEEAERIIPQLVGILKKDLEVSKFNVLCVSGDSYLKLGIENGEGYAEGKEYRFEYLMIQNGEFAGVQMCCKNSEGKGIDHEIYPVFSVSCLPEESQELLSSILDIVEERLV